MLTATNKRIYQLSSSVEENGDSWIALRATISLVGLNRHPYFYFRVTDTDPSFFTNDPDFYRDWVSQAKARPLNWIKAKPVIQNLTSCARVKKTKLIRIPARRTGNTPNDSPWQNLLSKSPKIPILCKCCHSNLQEHCDSAARPRQPFEYRRR